MKIVICGAGEVGGNLASFLCTESNDITVIDNNAKIINEINQREDVRGITGHASHPDVLKKADAGNADMIIAATQSDEINMVTCQMAHTLFNVPKKIARIRSQIYRDPSWGNLFASEHMPIDVIISPEMEVARAISERLTVPGAFNVMTFEKDIVRIIGVICRDDCPVLNTPLQHFQNLFPDLDFKIVTIIRDGVSFVPEFDEQILAGDEIYFIARSEQVSRIMNVFGFEQPEARKIIIIGGGNIGYGLANMIKTAQPKTTLKIIEFDRERAIHLNESLPDILTINGNALKAEILDEVNIGAAETVIAVTNDDETNILVGLLAKQRGAGRSISLINKSSYGPIIPNLGLDAVVSPRSITVSTILQHIRRGKIKAIRKLRQGSAEILEFEAADKSKIVNIPYKDLVLPDGSDICALIRDNDVIIPEPNTEIKPNDKVIFINLDNEPQVIEELLAPKDRYY
ncbi:MAG: Trk system potassium transporter TrkA [Rickettsiales bacterium]|nr:Trk system potassium transporter TrkA [Rickettsiales bacterium]